MPECRKKVSPASAFLPVVRCFIPASAFRHQGSVQYRWSRTSPSLPSYAIRFLAHIDCYKIPEPIFVNLLRSPGIDSQLAGWYDNPMFRTDPPGYIVWWSRFLGIDS